MELELTDEEVITLRKFVEFATNIAKHRGVLKWKLHDVANEMGIQIVAINKGGNFSVALWVEFLKITKLFLPPDCKMKYPNMSEFLNSYPNFERKPEHEKYNLFNTANWMNILFEMLPAKKNKGLAMSVIPKLVEGYHVKYVTGSGQTSATSDRVHIFEQEGSVKPFARSKSSRKRKTEAEAEVEDQVTKKVKTPTKNKPYSLVKQEKLQSTPILIPPLTTEIRSRDYIPLVINNNSSTDDQIQEFQLLNKYEARDELGIPLLNRTKTDLVAVEALYKELEGENRSLRNTFDEHIFDCNNLLSNLSFNSNPNETERTVTESEPPTYFASLLYKPNLESDVSNGDSKKSKPNLTYSLHHFPHASFP